MKLTGRKVIFDRCMGVRCGRTWFPWDVLGDVIKADRPDVIVIPAHAPVKMALAALQSGRRPLMMLQDVELSGEGEDFSTIGIVPCVANSAFTAKKYEDSFGLRADVVHPLFERTDYETQTFPDVVTFVNPHPKKGVDVALGVAAACPHIPFVFVRTWPLDEQTKRRIDDRIKTLSNVQMVGPVGDMKSIYRKTKILLAPSQWIEAYGRVATEAQFSGIPVVASDIGGLGEAVGPGGILIDPKASVDVWAAAIDRLWSNPDEYRVFSNLARAHANRPALNPAEQIKRWEAFLRAAAETGPL